MNGFNPFAEFRQSLGKSVACSAHPPIARSRSPEEAALWWDTVQTCAATARTEHLRWLARHDLFFLCVYILNRKHFLLSERISRWTFEGCQMVQDDPNGYADLWPRESFKSEIISFGLTIQDILNDPEVTFGIFSHNRPMAKDFMAVIKREFESNELLKSLFAEILWQEPKLEARSASVSWSENDGITVKRKGNRKEATIEAWGLVDGQPTGKRYQKILYEDVVNRDHISPDMIHRTTQELINSLMLKASDPPVYRYVATYQEIGDTTQQVIERGIFKMRRRSPFDAEGLPAYCSDENFAILKRSTDTKTFALQILLDPTRSKAENDIGFAPDWIDYYDELPSRRAMNVYIVVDPAGKSTESNSHFAMWVLGLCADRRARVLDMVRDKLDLEGRWEAVFAAVQKWEPLKVGYEKFAMQSDIEHFHYRMRQVNWMFTIIPLGGTHQSKDQRIEMLIPWYRDRRFLFPRKGIRKTLKDGSDLCLTDYYRDSEYLLWPYNKPNRDLLDAQARICDSALGVVWPRAYGQREDGAAGGGGYGSGATADGSWMTG
ncbi:MAG: hypothetical protein ABSG46_18180, partial [Candidatus Binataceae bacterium]